MKVTINKDLISELYPIDRKDLFVEYWNLMFYRRYHKGETRRHGFLWLFKEVVKEDIYAKWLVDGMYTREEAVKELGISYDFSECVSMTFAEGTWWRKPCVHLKMMSGSVYHIYKDTYEEAAKWIEDFTKNKINFETIEASKQ